MTERKNGLFETVVRKAVGLPTGASNCCGGAAAETGGQPGTGDSRTTDAKTASGDCCNTEAKTEPGCCGPKQG